MTKEKIYDMVDRKILTAFSEGISIGAIQSDLKVRMNNFKKTIEKDCKFEDIYNQEFEDIKNIRHRYGITYVKQCQKRINDLNWILDKNSKFNKLSNLKIFKLIQFKEKILTNLEGEFLPPGF